MQTSKRKALESAGWKVGDAADFLEMDEQDRQLLDLRVQLARATRLFRESAHLSQKQLSARLNTSQPRIAKIEQAAPDVSLDQLVRALTATGGRIVVKLPTIKPGRLGHSAAKKPKVVLEIAAGK